MATSDPTSLTAGRSVPLPNHARADEVAPDGDDTVSPSQVYDAFIVTHPGICNGCFHRYRAMMPAPDDHYWDHEYAVRSSGGSSQSLRQIASPQTIRATNHGVVANAPPVIDWRNSPEKRPRPAWVCKDCGVIDGEPDTQARPVQELIDAAKRVHDRLCEQDVPCDRDGLLDSVREMKTTPATAGKDFEILAASVAAGVRDAVDADADVESES